MGITTDRIIFEKNQKLYSMEKMNDPKFMKVHRGS